MTASGAFKRSARIATSDSFGASGMSASVDVRGQIGTTVLTGSALKSSRRRCSPMFKRASFIRRLARASVPVRQGIEPAMFGIGRFVHSEAFDHARPEPRRRIQRFGSPFHNRLAPRRSFGVVKLAPMSLADHAAKIARHGGGARGFGARQFKLQILQRQFSQDDGPARDRPHHHSLAKVRRQRLCAGNDANGIRPRHGDAGRARCSRFDRLLDIDKRHLRIDGSDPHQDGVSKPAERTAPLHPIGGVDDGDRAVRIVGAASLVQPGQEILGVGAFNQRSTSFSFGGLDRPEPLAQRDFGLRPGQPFLGQLGPAALNRSFQQSSDRPAASECRWSRRQDSFRDPDHSPA